MHVCCGGHSLGTVNYILLYAFYILLLKTDAYKRNKFREFEDEVTDLLLNVKEAYTILKLLHTSGILMGMIIVFLEHI